METLFSIKPLADNPNNLAISTTLLDSSMFDIFGVEAGNPHGIVTVHDNGCKTDQCRHADGSQTALLFAFNVYGSIQYDPSGSADRWFESSVITATCDCDESKGETAHHYPFDFADPFECICDADQEKFQTLDWQQI